MIKKRLVIELRGVDFVNKGAELMLNAIRTILLERYPDIIFVMQKNPRAPAAELNKNNIYIKFLFRNFRVKWENVAYFLPRTLLLNRNYVLPQDIDLVLDGSGFAFGDQWGAQYAQKRLGNDIAKWKNEGKKVILLPQAFGPFNDEALHEVMKKIINHSDLIFAREKQSYEYMNGINASPKIKLAPDFTNLISGVIPKDFDATKNDVAIIPNYKMIEKILSKEEYLAFLNETIQALLENGKQPYFLIHEGEKDRSIAEEANARLAKPISLFHYANPLAVKGIISTASFIICSRFHGVVSALSQGVPCLATSWSHKYEMLMEEYGYPEGVIKDLKDFDNLKNKINELSNPDKRKEISQRLKDNSAIQKKRSKEAWEQIFDFINNIN
ncbi:polysaccharide pyruvyl transferase family protein [Olivibacter domesticus]|uniref:Colanic acid/amylovoran biosynthesis protein n=1 Tax=Olivibacter domesticus TaxID=407022 RepID=A0A1H7UP53_OLID1|nr:polysaccharide pyruvyl transferase family protein [Olivibacter domesticus]SEL98733.1 colanic acid/amylovoran biosynthesis protein [Olivibacter domesticus]